MLEILVEGASRKGHFYGPLFSRAKVLERRSAALVGVAQQRSQAAVPFDPGREHLLVPRVGLHLSLSLSLSLNQFGGSVGVPPRRYQKMFV